MSVKAVSRRNMGESSIPRALKAGPRACRGAGAGREEEGRQTTDCFGFMTLGYVGQMGDIYACMHVARWWGGSEGKERPFTPSPHPPGCMRVACLPHGATTTNIKHFPCWDSVIEPTLHITAPHASAPPYTVPVCSASLAFLPSPTIPESHASPRGRSCLVSSCLSLGLSLIQSRRALELLLRLLHHLLGRILGRVDRRGLLHLLVACC